VLLFSVLFTDFVDVEEYQLFRNFQANHFLPCNRIDSRLLRCISICETRIAGRWSQYTKDSGKFDYRYFCMSSKLQEVHAV